MVSPASDCPDWGELRLACRRAFPRAILLDDLRCAAAVPVPCPDLAARLAPTVGAVSPGERIVLIVSDQTRKTGAAVLLPVLWAGWRRRGIRADDVTVLVACGSHRGPTEAEQEQILGSVFWQDFRGRVVVHDAFRSPCVRVGTTRRGTPVEIHERVVRADAVISLGGVVFHYFAGFTGGRKSILPGVASARTIAANHSLTIDTAAGALHPGVQIGALSGNPVAEDMAEGAALVPVRSTVQTVLDPAGALVGVFSGELGAAHTQACARAASLVACSLPRPADLVVAYAGPARNWLQSHKALVNASRGVHAAGTIVLFAACPEGLGSESLARWLGKGSPAAVIAGIAESADINSQTALSTMVRGRQTVLVSQLPPAVAALTKMTPAGSVTEALALARARLLAAGITAPVILFMPEAWLTVPVLPVTAGPVQQVATP